VLLDQKVVAGIGNIYAVEALFEARIDPHTPASDLDDDAWESLAAALQEVLRTGLQGGGTTLRDFRNLAGEPGRNQNALRVYGREDRPCLRCGATLRRFTFGGRSGAYCPQEQV
jgi:formamidopyrimidine-DNA glycosylase